MTGLNQTQLEALPHAFAQSRVAVIGDLMVDRYIFGNVHRISPEAPVPVLDIELEQTRLGGAANVGHNIHGLGATPVMIGIVGDDEAGAVLSGIFADLGFPLGGIVIEPLRPTTIKTRVVAGSQQMLRIDHEVKTDVSASTEDRLIAALEHELPTLDAIIIEDYNKGVITASLIARVIALGTERGIPVLVDPKFHNFFEYRGATVFKPNRHEVENALGVRLQTEQEFTTAGKSLIERLDVEHLLLTLGEKGMMLLSRDQESNTLSQYAIPTRARQVADVSGAGDTVIATLSVALSCGLSMQDAAVLANRAAGLVIEELGIVPIYHDQLIRAMLEDLSSASV